ncbi:MAG: methyltransferase domain-containing protein, partial [Planctomycetota bacterium]
MNKSRFSAKRTSVLWALCILSLAKAEPNDFGLKAERIFNEAGVKGGLVVHIGSGDGRLTAALGEKNCYIVQGLEADADKVREARQHV